MTHAFLKILYLGTLPPHPGGSAVSCAELLAGFGRLGHLVRAVAPISPQASESADKFETLNPEIPVERFPVPFDEFDTVQSPASEYRKIEGWGVQEKLPAMIAKERPDVLLIGRDSFFWHVPDVVTDPSIPIVLRLSGGGIQSLLRGVFSDKASREFVNRMQRADVVIAQAEHMRQAAQALGLPNVVVIPNAVDLGQFRPRPKDPRLIRELGLTPEDVVAVHVSNLKPIKDPGLIVESALQVLKTEPRLLYVVVGDGPLLGELKESCQARHLTDRFRFPGWVEYSRMPDYINLADIVIMPSREEQQARVYIETQACGRLLLASNIAASREVVRDGQTGLLFEVGNAADLAAKTLRAAANPELRDAIGQRALTYVQRHSLSTVLPQHVAALRRVGIAG